MNTPDARPWYQQFWVWFVIAIPALAVTFSLQFVYIAFTHQDPVVRGDWYQDGKSVNQSFIRSDRASALGLRADIRFDEVTGEVLLTLHSREPQPAGDLTLNFVHATQPGRDQRLVLRHLAGNDWRGQLERPLDGLFNIELSTPQWQLESRRQLPDGDGFTLAAP